MNDSEQQPLPRYFFPKPYADFVQRLRVAGGFLLLVAFAWLAHPSRESLIVGLPVSITGLLLRSWATGHLAKDRELATTGPYARMRNPLYTGTLIVALGMVVACRSIWLAVVFAAVFLLVYFPAIELEEQHLRNIFPCYTAYAFRVHRFLPVTKWNGRRARFSWALYRRNEEYKALAGFLLAVAWLAWRLARSL